ncbi:MAG: single-strand DNA-binding protein [Candidatus Peregrinibacteria bacterium Gr01-1014_25]|nr:MAG: single-strand DNA-binding protein [Candidatus Peregrinibacteria bacterium Gr01-1014_25]
MKSVNRVTLLGNVTRDPEIKATVGGQSVCTFGLATNRVWKDAQGQKQSLPEYHNLVAWGGLADFCHQNVRKGKPLYIEGYLKTRSWENDSGTKQFRTEIVMDNIVLIGPRPEGATSDAHDHADQSVDVPVEVAA